MSKLFNKKYCPCPACTYPLSRCYLGIEKDKHGVKKEIVRIYCTNKNCPEHYEKMQRRKAKWQ